MNRFWFVFIAFFMGFLTAIPVGAAQIEIAKRSLSNHLWAAYMVALGTVSSDVMYGFIAMFGIAPYLEKKAVVAIFGFFATAVLLLLAFFTLKNNGAGIVDLRRPALKSKKLSLAIGFMIAAANPMMIVWWLIGEKLIRELGLINNFTTNTVLLFLASAGLGILSYLIAISNILYWSKKFISNAMMKKINYGLGLALVLMAFYFLISSIHKLVTL